MNFIPKCQFIALFLSLVLSLEQITDDIQKITTRLNDLKEKVKNQPELHQEKIHAAEIENQRNRKRAYRQLESDERQVEE